MLEVKKFTEQLQLIIIKVKSWNLRRQDPLRASCKPIIRSGDPSKAAGDITKPRDVSCKEEFVEIFPEPQSSLPDWYNLEYTLRPY